LPYTVLSIIFYLNIIKQEYERVNSQLKKGALEVCVLALLKKRDHYGYELVQEISRYIEISEGTIYPLLRRLSKEDVFDTYLRESEEGPPRKYYKLTGKGSDIYNEKIADWTTFINGVSLIIKEVS
jgi:PadR family transcriptional regulator, regulatory protein PadR